ncbi:MAG: prolipoprotein diacylglyceryl transferase [Alphaproteobacteria bacterium]|nr:prolipoprotein diacylglyceryl transferase [Alphaproteobacteria bacterium]
MIAAALTAALTFPDIDPAAVTIPAFEVFGLTIGPLALRWYALAYIAGLALGWRYMVVLCRAPRLWHVEQVKPTALQLDDFLFWAALGVILGGRLGYVLFYGTELIWTRPLEVFAIWHGGMSFHGGLIGVAVAIVLFARAQAIPVMTMGDLAAAAAPIGLFFGRIANFINGELWGRPTDVPWGVVFPTGGPYPRHPSQLYEAALEGIVLFLILRVMTHRFHALERPGLTTGAFLIGYGVFRTMVEFVREPDVQRADLPFGLTMGMILSSPMILAGVAFVIFALRSAKRA